MANNVQAFDANTKMEQQLGPDKGVSFEFPFNQAIIDEPHQPNTMFSHLRSYDGTTDPESHVKYVRKWMLIMNVSDASACKVFMSTLTGEAADWFDNLPPSSIYNFEMFAEAFVDYFFYLKQRRLKSFELLEVKQQEGESLRDYLNRYRKASVSVSYSAVKYHGKVVTTFNHEVAVVCLINGLRHEGYKLDLKMDMPESLYDAMGRSQKYIREEDYDNDRRAELNRMDNRKRRRNRYQQGRKRGRRADNSYRNNW